MLIFKYIKIYNSSYKKWLIRRNRKRYKKIFFVIMNIYNNLFSYLSFISICDKHVHFFIKDKCNVKFLKFLKLNCYILSKQLLDLIVVDRLELNKKSKYRFEVIYIMNSIIYNIRIFVRCFLYIFSFIESVVNLFNSSNWLEREAWDMFGIIFINHPDLRRILTDYGFLGHPLKKDFPLTGYMEVRYDEINKSIVNEPLELAQEFRQFRLENAWKKW